MVINCGNRETTQVSAVYVTHIIRALKRINAHFELEIHSRSISIINYTVS